MGKTKELPAYPKGITFEQVWAALMEDRERQMEDRKQQMEDRKRQIEYRKQQMEYRKQQMEDQEQHKEWKREIDQILKENAFLMGRLSKRMGEVVEYMVAPNLREKFNELGLNFSQTNQNTVVSDRTNKIFLEIDVILENGDKVMLVEVKTKPTTEHVRDHINRLEKMRVYADLHGDKRTFLGAVAGAVMTDNVKEYVLKQGFFAIEPSGESFNIIPPNGKPKEW